MEKLMGAIVSETKFIELRKKLFRFGIEINQTSGLRAAFFLSD